jgi:hypothetical protein
MSKQPTNPFSSKPARFALGQVFATPGALDALDAVGLDAWRLLERHVAGDWGDVPAPDALANEAALQCEGRLLSSYPLGNGVRVWIITEADRSVTTLLLPDEY